ncbi:MAG: prepilin-type N-terminal cleavage/methylation domain-containing protein [Clostridia bacterium]|nr:prepilin-type N-terminal cleavage/methylation domain-containing protein [Clostridia bacterium]
MKNLKKKAFTLVELLVVIAIIAILAVAGVVGYVVFTKKAQQSNDTSLVSQLNEYMAAASSTDDINTVTDARNLLIEDGIDLASLKLTAKGYRAAFDITSKKFVKVNKESPEDYSGNAEDLFVFVSNEADATTFTNAGYSVYLQNGFNAATLNVKSGVDVGENNGISAINYTSTDTKEVVIRTNSYTTNVTVNTKGSVQHYGNVGKLTIEEVAMSSFHEFGKVRTAEIIKGNFVIEEKAVVTLVSVKAETAGQVKIDIDNQGTVEVVAGDATKYEVTSTKKATETIDAVIADNTLAIVDGVAKTSLAAEDFGDGKKVVLLKDFDSTEIALGSCEVVGNMTKLKASISGDKTIVLKNIHSTNITVGAFVGSLTLDGGFLECQGSNDQNAAIKISNGYGTYVFKNMTVAANTNKAIKISKAKSVTIENCIFDATNLDSTVDVAGAFTARSLAAIDIQEQNGATGKMTVVITGNTFKDIPQGAITGGVADSDTAGAVKIKTEKAERSSGFAKVTISNNTFINNYRDVVVGCNVYKTTTSTKEQADMDAADNTVAAPVWEIKNNTTTLTAEVVANRATLTYYNNSDLSASIAEKVGRIEGGCAVFETARSARSWLNA